jgi:hypothetical protein
MEMALGMEIDTTEIVYEVTLGVKKFGRVGIAGVCWACIATHCELIISMLTSLVLISYQ